MLETALAKLLTLKVGAALFAATATGGVALAAANGTLPNPLSEPSAKPTAHVTGKPFHEGRDKSPSAAKGSPSPSLVGLCRAFTAGAGESSGKALENPAFTALITAAGDKEKVAAYCDDLLAREKAKPGNPPSARPSADVSHPTGKPETRPSAAQTRPTNGGPRTAPSASPAR